MDIDTASGWQLAVLFSIDRFVLLGNTPNFVLPEDLTLSRSMLRRYLQLSPGTHRRYAGQRAPLNCHALLYKFTGNKEELAASMG